MSDSELEQTSRQIWDDAAATFDDEPDHGLRDPEVRAAWVAQLAAWLPAAPARVLDIGCGTGSLSVVLAGLGHTVTGIDFSPRMIALAEAKARAAGLAIEFGVMDAADPLLPTQYFDVVMCRHLLWMMARPAEVLQRWAALLKPNGRLILIEGYWHTGAGLTARQVVAALPPAFGSISVAELSHEPALWGGSAGGPVTDERYAVVALLPPQA